MPADLTLHALPYATEALGALLVALVLVYLATHGWPTAYRMRHPRPLPAPERTHRPSDAYRDACLRTVQPTEDGEALIRATRPTNHHEVL